MLTSRQTVDTFIKRMSRTDATVKDLYAKDFDWIEMPTGRPGGRHELFGILRKARREIKDFKFDVISLIVNEDQAVLEVTGKAVLRKPAAP